jgi:hypothetical protein
MKGRGCRRKQGKAEEGRRRQKKTARLNGENLIKQ